MLTLIQKHKVTCLHFVPSMLNVFISSLFDEPGIKESLSSLRCVITSGEALPAKSVQNWYSKIDAPIHNLYGPTEASVDVTHYTTRKEDTLIPIGKPIWNTQIHIVDETHQLLPIGEMGEICISGDGLARGYINRPELTAERFVPNPFSEGQRMYKTGDYGRWLPDGNIEYLGRKDDQVKIRGYRIELGEVEKVMSDHPSIDQCVVVAKEFSESSRLIGYYTPNWKYIKEREAELYNRQVANWKELFENEYEKTENKENIDEEFNFIGWGDSFTGDLIPADHMREWLQDIVNVIKSEKPGNVLEIGCGTGMIYYQLADAVKKYIGTDISSSGINQIKKRINKGLRDYCPTELKVCAAHEISLNKDEKVDTIILNSIVQFFSGEEYLTKVIEKCISLLDGKGRIVIGDVRDYRLLQAFKSRLQASKLDGNLTIKEFKEDIEQQLLKEEEICYAPDYFYSLQTRFPQINFVDIQQKQGEQINELTLYRYNVVLHVGIEKAQAQPHWQNWNTIKDVQSIVDRLKSGEKVIALQGVPNCRLWKEQKIQKALATNNVSNVNELLDLVKVEDPETKAVRDMMHYAKSIGYYCRLLLDNDPFKINVVLEKEKVDAFIKPPYQPQNNSQLFTNIPLFNDINALLQIELKAHLGKFLPEYMVPSHLVPLRSIPLNANGKADRKALPDVRLTPHVPQNYVAPRNKTEKMIASIWGQLLGIEQVGVFDNFFDLGGNSLMAVQIMAKLEKELGAKLPLAILFQHPTVQKLADVFLSQHETISWNSLVALKPSGNKVPLYFIHGANGDVLFLRPFTTQVHPEQPIYALRPPGVSGQGKLLDNIEEMAALYIKEILKHNPDGPYALSGYSFGGYVAYEMARQLKAMGKEVKMVA
ncbi:MAG TPA: AMP-binding protein, partial [Flavisolibacter sp.]|nr:AMP-binding protein [Flavisolibacter sp.]